MKLDCFLSQNVDLDIRPSSNRREWMDATDERFAYRCLPLSIANAHGWVICCRGSFEVEWNGGQRAPDVQVFPLDDGPIDAEGHFGYGILTFSPRAMFRTESGHNLWITGPPNSFKDGIQALSAVIEADWMPYTFSMNWKITRPHHRIRFEKGEPYCFLFPVQRGMAESVTPALRDLEDEPEGKHQLDYAGRMRDFVGNVRTLKEQEGASGYIRNEKAITFQMWYMKGRLPDGSGVFEGHQKSILLRPFEDRRSRSVEQAEDSK